jgi:hypothetical protein
MAEYIVRKAADAAVTTGRLGMAIGYGVLAGLSFLIAGWFFSFATNWFSIGLTLLFGCYGGKYLMKAGEAYQAARPTKPPHELQRKLEGRMMYVPKPREPNRRNDD